MLRGRIMRTNSKRATTCASCGIEIPIGQGAAYRHPEGHPSRPDPGDPTQGHYCVCKGQQACRSRAKKAHKARVDARPKLEATVSAAIQLVERGHKLSGQEKTVICSLLRKCVLRSIEGGIEVVCPSEFIRTELSKGERLEELTEVIGVQITTCWEELQEVEVALGVAEAKKGAA